MDNLLEEEKKTKQTIVEDFANKLHDDMKVVEEHLTHSHHLAEKISEFEEERNKLQLKADEAVATKSELEFTKLKLWSAVERVEALQGELETSESELQSLTAALEVGKLELKGIREELETAREENNRLQQLNTVVVNRLGEKDYELAMKTKELLDLAAKSEDLTTTKVELNDLHSEIRALQSVIASKQEVIVELEGESKARLAATERLERERQDAANKISQLSSELEVSARAIEELQKLKIELENDLSLEKKVTEDLKQQNSLLVTQLASKQGDVGGLVTQVGKLTEELHNQEKICADLKTELQCKLADNHAAENQSKQLTEKLVEIEVTSARLHSELAQQLSYLRTESDNKSKTISNLEDNIATISSQLSQAHSQLEELVKITSQKSDNIAQLDAHVSSLDLQQQKDKVELQALAKLSKERLDSIAELNAELARRSAEALAIEHKLKLKSNMIADLERKSEDAQSGLGFAEQEIKQLTHQLEQKTSELSDHKTKLLEMSSASEEEHVKAQHAAGEIREKLANLEIEFANISNELDDTKRAHAADTEKHRVTVNSLVIMVEDIFRRIQAESEEHVHQNLPDLAAYWTSPPHREVLPDMEARKLSIDSAIKQIKANTAHSSQVEARLLDVEQLLESEKLMRAKLESEKSQALTELDKHSATLRSLALEEEARATLAQQMGKQLISSTGDEGVSIIVAYLETSIGEGASNPALTQAFRNVLHSSQLKSKDNADLRISLESTQASLHGKIAELELKNADLAAKDRQLAENAHELSIMQSSCADLTAQLHTATLRYEATQSKLAQHAHEQEELRVVKDSLSKAEAEKTQLEAQNKILKQEKAKLEADYKLILQKLEQILAERTRLLALWGIKDGENLVGLVKEAKERLENELQMLRVLRLDLESENQRLKVDLGEAAAERASALERLARAESAAPPIARRGVAHADVQGVAPGSALRGASPFKTSPLLAPFAVGPHAMPTIALSPASVALGAGAALAAQKRTLAIGGIGLGSVLKTFMTEHSAVPEDLELVDDGMSSPSLMEGLLRGGLTSSKSSRSSSIADPDERRDEEYEDAT